MPGKHSLKIAGNKPVYYLFNLDCFPRLRQHHPYYIVLGDVMTRVLKWNLSYESRGDEELKRVIHEELVKNKSNPIYFDDNIDVQIEIERVVFFILKYIHRQVDPIVINAESRLEYDILIIGVSAW